MLNVCLTAAVKGQRSALKQKKTVGELSRFYFHNRRIFFFLHSLFHALGLLQRPQHVKPHPQWSFILYGLYLCVSLLSPITVNRLFYWRETDLKRRHLTQKSENMSIFMSLCPLSVSVHSFVSVGVSRSACWDRRAVWQECLEVRLHLPEQTNHHVEKTHPTRSTVTLQSAAETRSKL